MPSGPSTGSNPPWVDVAHDQHHPVCSSMKAPHVLAMPLISLPAVSPRERMAPNEKCWCLSGLKWKKCHKIRQFMDKANPYREAASLREDFAKGTCLYHEATGADCGDKAIASHTIQRGGGLAAIKERGHVYSIKMGLEDLIKNDGQPVVKKLGVGKASTFPGFCNKHDTELFLPIEKNNLSMNKGAALLFAYRAFSLEYFNKRAASKSLSSLKLLDAGTDFSTQAMIQTTVHNYVAGANVALRDTDSTKRKFDSAIVGNDLSNVRYYAVYFDGVLPIVNASAWLVEEDFQGNRLQNLLSVGRDLEDITFTITSDGARSVCLFSWIGNSGGQSEKFVESFKKIPNDRKANVLINACFELSENAYFKISWWDALKEAEKNQLLRRVQSGTPRSPAKNGRLVDDAISVVSFNVISEVEEL